jgi:hypothetical protein
MSNVYFHFIHCRNYKALKLYLLVFEYMYVPYTRTDLLTGVYSAWQSFLSSPFSHSISSRAMVLQIQFIDLL